MLAHGCSQHVVSPVVPSSAPSWLVESVVTRTASIELTTAVVSGTIRTEKVLSWPIITRNSPSATDLASSIGCRVVEAIIMIDRASHVQRVVPPTRSRWAPLIVVQALLVKLRTTSERPTTTPVDVNLLALLLLVNFSLSLHLDLLLCLNSAIFLLLVAASVLTSILTRLRLFSFNSNLLLLSGARLGCIISWLFSIGVLAPVPTRPTRLGLLILRLLILRSLSKFLLGQFFGLRPLLALGLGRSRGGFLDDVWEKSFLFVIFRSSRLSPALTLGTHFLIGFGSFLTLLLLRVRCLLGVSLLLVFRHLLLFKLSLS